ncbi:hypothetical protein EVAR_36659_1 [Eumeta japonica]|uniref:Uncharacterized protein n=1 Tax=Eumeta variegata TaxID=151549 RepID=A0A4C1XWT7_EUMVA|nr:hypothetical protein EVAR_36659_1 [Eumeta japonica]
MYVCESGRQRDKSHKATADKSSYINLTDVVPWIQFQRRRPALAVTSQRPPALAPVFIAGMNLSPNAARLAGEIKRPEDKRSLIRGSLLAITQALRLCTPDPVPIVRQLPSVFHTRRRRRPPGALMSAQKLS